MAAFEENAKDLARLGAVNNFKIIVESRIEWKTDQAL